jgi:hypothetical protein
MEVKDIADLYFRTPSCFRDEQASAINTWSLATYTRFFLIRTKTLIHRKNTVLSRRCVVVLLSHNNSYNEDDTNYQQPHDDTIHFSFALSLCLFNNTMFSSEGIAQRAAQQEPSGRNLC